MLKRLMIIILCVLSIQFVISSQLNTRVFYPILSNSFQDRQVFSILESKDGFMWFVNDYGVSRYDGKHIKNYFINVGWRGVLKNNTKGEIFAATSNGFCYKYNELSDNFDEILRIIDDKPHLSKFIKTNSDKEIISENKKNNDIFSMDVDAANRLWLLTKNAVVCYDSEQNKLIEFKIKNLEFTYLAVVDKYLYLFGKDKICTMSINQSKQKKEEFKTKKHLEINDNIISAYFDSNTGNLYFGTFNKGVYCLSGENEISQLIALNNSPVRSIKMYGSNLLLVGIDGLGIYEYNINERRIESIQKTDENKIGSLGSNAIYDIYVDSSNRIWVATYSKGVNIYDPNQIHFIKISHLIDVENSLANNYVNTIFEDKNKNLWFGTNNGISIKRDVDNKWIHLINNKIGIEKNSAVLAICYDSKAKIWAGGYGFGLLNINPATFSINSLNLYKSTNELVNNFIFALNNDGKSIWGGGVSNNLFSLNSTNNNSVENFHVNNIRVIENKDENYLVLITNTQVLFFDKRNGKIDTKIDTLIKNNERIKANVKFICLKQSGDNLWIGTLQYGIIRYSYSTNKTIVYNISDGLPSNNVLSIEIDNNNCLWLGTDEGLCYLNPATNIIIPFKTQEGSEKGIFNYCSSVKRSDGTLIFGTKQGAISFNPATMLTEPKRGLLTWTEFNLLNQTANSRKIFDILEKPLNESDRIELKYSENSFSMSFQELNYNLNIITRYSYKLDGYDNAFSMLSNNGSVSYYNLPPGKYNLIVRSYFADKDGKYIEKSIVIKVNQPWWNTIWAWIVWFILFCLTGYGVYRYSKNRLDRRYSDEKIRFFINVSHDMRTPITLIKAPLGDLLNDNTLSSSSRYLVTTINNNVNRLFDMINRILDFEKSAEDQMRLFPQEYELNQYIQEIAENFHSYADIRGITIEDITLSEPLWVQFDKIKMEMVVENLISNAIKYSKQGGYVKIIAGCNSINWWIEVQDNGIGIPLKEQQKIFKRFFRAENAINSKQIGSGMGLLLVNNLTKFMGGTVFFESEEGVKTVFRITFPLDTTSITKNNHLSGMQNTEKPIIENDISNKPSVLFVDDNDEIRDYISNRLSGDYKIILAQSANEALTILQNTTVNIVISDIMMPEVSGVELCEEIKGSRSLSHIPVVLLSALSEKKDILKGLQIGADDYITKPFDSVFLKQRIDNILANRIRLENYFKTQNGKAKELIMQNFINELDKLFIEKLERTIEVNISNPEYTIETLCRDIGMSRTVFYNRLKNLMNISPNDYLRARRMEKAAELLITRKYIIIEVAEMVGYTDVKHFSSLFVKYFNCSPSKYVKQVE